MNEKKISFNKDQLFKYIKFFNLSLEEVIQKITTEKTKENKKEIIRANLKNGEIEINFLNKIAEFLKLDISSFFFSEFREPKLTIEFKRKNPKIPITIEDQYILRFYQNIREDIAIFDENTFSKPIKNIKDNVIKVAQEYRDKFQLNSFLKEKKRKEDEVFKFLREKIEQEIYVFKNNKGERGQKEGLSRNLQGCIFLDEEFPPLILLNSDYPITAQISTLLHEYAHFLLGIDEIEVIENIINQNETEKWCNRFAYHVMIPQEIERDIKQSFSFDKLDSLSKKYFISKASFVVRFKELKIIDKKKYVNFFQESSNFTNNKQSKYDKNTSKGGNYHNTKKERLSKKFLNLISNSYVEGKISRSEFAKYVGIKEQKVQEYLV